MTPSPSLAFILATWFLIASTAWSEPMISEILAAPGEEGLRDEEGELTDWIELYNAGEESVNLDGYGLSDTPETVRFVFPDVVLPAKGYLVIHASGKDRAEAGGTLHTDFRLDRSGEYLALTDPEGQVLTAFDPAYPGLAAGGSYGVVDGEEGVFSKLPLPTPGGPNTVPPPLIGEMQYSPQPADPNEKLTITVAVRETSSPIARVDLLSRVMFRNEARTPMLDDGVAPDEAAGDGIFTAQISNRTLFGLTFKPGHLVRWAVEAEDVSGNVSRFPSFDGENTEAYTGTVLAQESVETQLDVFHWFVEEPRRAEAATGTQSVVVFRGELYDNVFTRIRGGTARSWPKKSFKVEFPDDHHFQFDPELPRVDEFNLNATYTDKSYVRAILTTELHQASGTPSPVTFPLRVHQNGEFYSVALFVEQCDRDFLRRNGLDPDGAYYKANPGSTYTSSGPFEKKTRDHEGKEDLEAFLDGLRLEGRELENFLFDSVDVPAQTNFQAGIAITQNIDNSDKNHFLYRDTEGSGEFFMTPWDLDLTFGPDALNTDRILANEERRGASNPNAVHPFIGSKKFPLHAGKTSELLDAMFTTSRTKDMFLRRLRTLHETYLATDHFEKRMDELVAWYEKDTLEDREAWGSQSHFPGSRDGMAETVERIKNEYLIDRRDFFERGGLVEIPGAMPEEITMEVMEVEFAPASGNQAEEYIRLKNPNRFAVDVSGWSLEGAVEHTFRPGTVVPTGSLFAVGRNEFYVVKDAAAFRQRTEGPSGGKGLFVQGNYRGSLSSLGEEIRLVDSEGQVRMTHVYEGAPSDWQQHLVISEFLPDPDESGAEFIELTNRGETPLDLEGVRFTRGVDFVFGEGTTLDPGAFVLLVRDAERFAQVYGAELPVVGEFGNATRLNNGGERIKLEDPLNNTVMEFEYGEGEAWPVVEQGRAYVYDLRGGGARHGGEHWAPSVEVGGAPNAEDPFEREPGGNPSEPSSLVEVFGTAWPAASVQRTVAEGGEAVLRVTLPLAGPASGWAFTWERSDELDVWVDQGEVGLAVSDEALVLEVPHGQQGETEETFYRVRVTRAQAAGE